MKCPVCDSHERYIYQIKKLDYNECLNCRCRYTKEDISSVLITQNKSPEKRNTKEMNATRLERIKEYIDYSSSIIDFGCGQGEYEWFLACQRYNCIGIDVGSKFQLSDFQTESVDVINCVEVIEHIIDPKPIVEEFKRVLRPNGIVYLETGTTDVLPKYEGLEESYINPEIGHVLIHSKKSLEMLFEGFKPTWINDFVVIFQKVC